ncbi:SDR family NAD(P)-dependent oxidoreductase [Fuchsiella alkaliacetigena]|uniref:SDR family NAD(P)-dependent oxidoreductase n=1 Tax=Fuchsiella alkaliacetigena TaxID=957042 RepID=UPI00200B9AD9|nr:SDR family oxidoreductase [Fuchsiella alkaliacetigena]MCK8824214.1 SDR family oxidoreductase [Fuchsiella alkaliacetigena]
MSEFREVKGKVAVVTGAARGIGAGAAKKMAEEGINVVVSDILPEVHETFKEIQEENPDIDGFAMEVDVSNEEQVKELIDKTVDELGQIDILVNNAGIHAGAAKIWEVEVEDVDKLMAVNFKGQLYGCKYASRYMKEQESGTIVNIGSFFGKVGHADSSVYGATKAAVHTMTQAISLELAPYNVNVNALCPGLAATEMHWDFVEQDADKLGITFEEMKQKELDEIPLGRYGYGKDMAGAVMFLASKAGEYITGQLINVNGGLDFS